MIIVKLKGGPGNQMFQYALGRNLAIKNKTELKIDLSFLLDRNSKADYTFKNYDLSIFNIKEKFSTKKDIRSVVGFLPTSFFGLVINKLSNKLGVRFFFDNRTLEKQYGFDFNMLNLKDRVYLDGYWQTEQYFKDISEIIRNDFSFKQSLEGRALGLAEKIRLSNSVFISIRRGDYITNPKANKFHGVLDQAYYDRAIYYMSQKLMNPEFFIFSDDIDWCENNFKIKYKHTFVKYEDKAIKFSNDLHLMSFCKHSIIANSTFAWWGAWLNSNPNKIVIAPKNWFANKSIDTSDLIPASWIRM